METISSTDAKQSFGALIDKAQREPVIIRKQNRDVAVMMSMDDYLRITSLNVDAFQSFRQEIGRKARQRGLTEEKLQSILSED
jgi:prevent-host-death family protein